MEDIWLSVPRMHNFATGDEPAKALLVCKGVTRSKGASRSETQKGDLVLRVSHKKMQGNLVKRPSACTSRQISTRIQFIELFLPAPKGVFTEHESSRADWKRACGATLCWNAPKLQFRRWEGKETRSKTFDNLHVSEEKAVPVSMKSFWKVGLYQISDDRVKHLKMPQILATNNRHTAIGRHLQRNYRVNA